MTTVWNKTRQRWGQTFALAPGMVDDPPALKGYCALKHRNAPPGYGLVEQHIERNTVLGYDNETGAEVRGDVCRQVFAYEPRWVRVLSWFGGQALEVLVPGLLVGGIVVGVVFVVMAVKG